MKQLINIVLLTLLVSSNAIANDGGRKPVNENFNLGGSKKSLTLMPNPATGETQILFVSPKDAKAIIKVLDADGKEVLKQENDLVTGKNKININHSKDLPEGNYTVSLTSANKNYTVAFVMWKL
ncbi:MAG: T9SS type A sorting domain-containing protein [Ferruginibacter sp.]